MPAARSRLVAALLALIAALAGITATPADATPSPPAEAEATTLTFDWPLDCDATVTQRAEYDATVSTVAYTVRVSERGAPGNLVVSFGDAEVLALLDRAGDPIDDIAGATSPFLTNPAIEIDRSGLPVAYGYEEWAERRQTADDDPVDVGGLPPVEHRLGVATWPTWVSLWTQLGIVGTDTGTGTDTGIGTGTDTGSGAPVMIVNEDGSAFTARLAATGELLDDHTIGLYGTLTVGATARAEVLVFADPATLQPQEATFEYFLGDGDRLIDRYDWEFDWSGCDDAARVSELPPPATTAPATTAPAVPTTAAPSAVTVPGFRTIHVDELPPEAHDTLALIATGGPYPYRQDDAVFENREGLLPPRARGYYREYTVETPGASTRGARRIVAGDGGELFYTDDHYDSFRVIVY